MLCIVETAFVLVEDRCKIVLFFSRFSILASAREKSEGEMMLEVSWENEEVWGIVCKSFSGFFCA